MLRRYGWPHWWCTEFIISYSWLFIHYLIIFLFFYFVHSVTNTIQEVIKNNENINIMLNADSLLSLNIEVLVENSIYSRHSNNKGLHDAFTFDTAA